MSSYEQNAEALFGQVLPELYVHKGRVCAYELEHTFGLKHNYAQRVMTKIEERQWVSDPYAHGHGPSGRNHPSYLFNKRLVSADHHAAETRFRGVASPSLVQVMLDTVSSKADINRGRDNPYSAVMYHGGIAVLATEYDLSEKRLWIGGVPGWTSFVELSLLRSAQTTQASV